MNITKLFAFVAMIFVSFVFSGVADAAEKPKRDRRADSVLSCNDDRTMCTECVQVKTKGWRGQTFSACLVEFREINPETGRRDGAWVQTDAQLEARQNVSGDVLTAIAGTVPAAAVQGVFAVRAAKELGCGDNCGTTINNTTNANAANHNVNNTSAINAPDTRTNIVVDTDVEVSPCAGTGICPGG